MTYRVKAIQCNIRILVLHMSLVESGSAGVVDQISEAEERVAYHKAKVKFWRSVSSVDGDSHSRKMVSDHERFMREWLKELDALRLAKV